MTCMDGHSKFAFCFLIKNKNSIIFSDKLDELCATEGRWKIFHTYNETGFYNSDFGNILNKYNMIHVKFRPRYHKSQWQIERFNATLKIRLAKQLYGSPKR
ncbi:hypothetical protein DMUE_1619 [Dictyocoela muelleri]|nr:hypothetical protein DMUE_1619 [Dictyocoela muelleri]